MVYCNGKARFVLGAVVSIPEIAEKVNCGLSGSALVDCVVGAVESYRTEQPLTGELWIDSNRHPKIAAAYELLKENLPAQFFPKAVPRDEIGREIPTIPERKPDAYRASNGTLGAILYS